MPLEIVRNDITKMAVDAIVNAAKESLLGGGGVDGCIHRAAGPELLQECRTLGGCRTGEAKLTGAYRLPCKYVIHTVGPVWNGGKYGEREQLASCYRTSLVLAKEHGCETVAFPLISSGIFGYPKDQALRVAVDTIGEFLLHNDMTVYIVIFSRTAYQISSKLFADIAEYVDDHYVDAHTDSQRERLRRMSVLESRTLSADAAAAPMAADGLDSLLAHLDAGFSETLLKLIDRSGKKDSEIYKKANVETVVLLSKGEIDSKKVRVEFSLEDMDMSGFQKGATYEQIKAYVLEHTGLKVSSLYISQIKRKCGLDVGQNYNLSKKEDAKVPKCPPEKEAAIRDALKYFQMI